MRKLKAFIRSFLGLNQYVSDLDQMLADFDHQHSLSETQKGEKSKHDKVFLWRDHEIVKQGKKGLWDGFT